ncbi:MAG TPA: RHS repeat-associated core domain-containing protein [Gammaproteobacteria bacterium]
MNEDDENSELRFEFVWSGQTFDTLGQAEAAMRGSGEPIRQQLVQTGKTSVLLDGMTIQYEYRIRHIQRVPIGPPRYFINGSCPFPWCGSEAGSRQAFIARESLSYCNVSLTPTGNWIPSGYGYTGADPGQIYEVAKRSHAENKNYKFWDYETETWDCRGPRPERTIINNQWTPISDCPPEYTAYTIGNGPNHAFCKPVNDVVDFITMRPIALACPKVVGNPIGICTGVKKQDETDFVSKTLSFRRHYNSGLHANVSVSIAPGWTHTYSAHLVLIRNSTIPVFAFRPSGEIVQLKAGTGSSNWKAVNGETYQVNRIGLEYSLKRPDGHTEQYSSQGKLLKVFSPSGQVIHTLSYNLRGLLASVVDGNSRQITFHYNPSERIDRITDTAGNDYRYEYDSVGNLIVVHYPDQSTRRYHYEGQYLHHLTGITDETGNRYATFSYDTRGRATLTEHANGVDRHLVTYEIDGNSRSTDAAGKESTYEYVRIHGFPRLNNEQDASGTRTTRYDDNGYVISRIDVSGSETSYARDSYGREIERTEAFGTSNARIVSTTWHSNLGRPVSVVESGRTTSHTYDASGNRLTETITDTATDKVRTTTWTYNDFDQVLTIDGPRMDVNDVTTYTYDSFGNLATVTNALGHLTQYPSYDAHGNPLEIIDPNGIVTKLAYDLRQRLVSRTVAFGTPSATTTLFDYDLAGQLEKTTLPNGSWISYEYDAAHRMTAIEDSAGNCIDYVLDAMGNRIEEAVTGPGGVVFNETFRDYNTLNRLVSEYGPEGSTVSYGYDAEGKRTTVTDAANNVTTSRYDALDRLFETVDALSGVTSYAYDARDNLTQVVDPRGVTTGYTYNGFNELVETDSPDAGITSYTYDKAGNRISQTDARSITTSFTYDALNRLTFIDYPGTDQDITYIYDGGASGCANCIGRLTRIDDETGYTTYSYDARGNLVNKLSVVETATGQQFLPVGYGYDSADKLTSLSYPSGDLVQYQRDAHGRVTGLTLTKADGAPVNLATNIQHAPFGPVTALTFGNGIAESRSFDQEGRISRIQSTALDLRYTWSTTGNITAITDNLDAARTQSFDYDALYRLTDASGIYGDLVYGYDAVGNRETLTATPPSGIPETTTYTYATTSNRLATITDASGTTIYQYDANGNTTDNGDHAFAYDNRNRLATADATNQYGHNALGQRVIKTTSTGTVLFVYDEAGHLLGEYDDLGNPIRQYVWLNDRPVAMLKKNGATTDVYYIHSDHLNTSQAVTDENQTVVWKADYKPFGEAEPTVTTLDMPLRFPGQIFDSETNLHYNYFRSYDSSIGRYAQSDPIGLLGGINLYEYAAGRPTGMFDALGLSPSCSCSVVCASLPVTAMTFCSKTTICIDECNNEKRTRRYGWYVWGNKGFNIVGFYSCDEFPGSVPDSPNVIPGNGGNSRSSTQI